MGSASRYDRAAMEMRHAADARAAGALDARELVRLATLAASSHNTQPWIFRVGPGAITIAPDFSRRCPVVDPDDGHLFKSLGCAAENLVHAASAQGYAAEVRFDSGQGAVIVSLERSASRHETDLSRAITRRQCVKKAYDGKPLETSVLRQLEDAARGDGVRAVVLTSAPHKEVITDYVAGGDVAQLNNPAFRRELMTWIRFNPAAALESGDGLSGRTAGQPPLPTWLAKKMIGWVLRPRSQADADATNIRSSAGVVVFVADADDRPAWVEVGRAYERWALRATALEVRSAFVNQPIEVRELRAQFESWLGLRGERALLMARFGRGPTAPFSLRRPVDQVIAGPETAAAV